MSSCYYKLRRRQILAIILLSVLLSPFPWLGPGTGVLAQVPNGFGPESDITYAKAGTRDRGVLVEWRGKPDPNNLGYNLYREQGGRRTRVNAEIIPGAIFAGVKHVAPPGDYSYARLDPNGTADSTYFIESVSVNGEIRAHTAIATLREAQSDSIGETRGESESRPDSEPDSQKEFPAGPDRLVFPSGPVEDQWNVAGQTGLKISIKSDGWYRVTQQQMSTTGFIPTVDIRYLSLFADGREVAIGTSKDVGQLTSGDYIEFYGRGQDLSTTDTRIYYLIAGTTPGKRIQGDVKPDSTPTPTPPKPGPVPLLPVAPLVITAQRLPPSEQHWFPWFGQFPSGDIRFRSSSDSASSKRSTSPRIETGGEIESPPNRNTSDSKPAQGKSEAAATNEDAPIAESAPSSRSATPETVKLEARVNNTSGVNTRKLSVKRNGKTKGRHRARPAPRPARSHAHAIAAAAAVSFSSTVEFKQRFLYFANLINGDAENYFGTVVSSAPVTQTLNVLNPELTAEGPAKLEVALQGVAGVFFFNHSVNVSLNGTQVATLNFGPFDHVAPIITIPISQVLSGANTVTFTRASSNDICLVDYIRLTYPHALKADNNALRFGLRSNQAAKVDGFTSPDIKLIDYTDPYSVKVVRPIMEATASGYNISVSAGPPAKNGRLLQAISQTQFSTPAAFSLNQPSTLNATTNGADLLIIAHKSLIPSAAPLVSLRQSQGMVVSVVDIEDVYDEFSFGTHGPQAIKNFLARANSSWTKKPKYVIFLGDADLDPRNYEGVGDFDLVPTKLIDATYNETASDDWLSDFDNDGIGEIPSGRLPVRTPAEANLAISKIVNFTPTNAPQSALLVADDPTGYYFNFEIANDEVEAQLNSLVPSMIVQRINKRTDPNAHDNIISKAFGTVSVPLPPGQGQALINYSGHGNVNTWTGSNIFTSGDASAAYNDNRLPLVLVLNCLNGYFQDPRLEGIAEALIKAPNGGAVAVFASSGETIPDGQHDMNHQVYVLLYGSPTVPLGDAIKQAKTFTNDIDVRRTWILFGDPSMKIR